MSSVHTFNTKQYRTVRLFVEGSSYVWKRHLFNGQTNWQRQIWRNASGITYVQLSWEHRRKRCYLKEVCGVGRRQFYRDDWIYIWWIKVTFTYDYFCYWQFKIIKHFILFPKLSLIKLDDSILVKPPLLLNSWEPIMHAGFLQNVLQCILSNPCNLIISTKILR